MSAVFKTGRKREPSPEDKKWESILEKQLKSTGKPSRDRIFASKAGLCERQTAGMIVMDNSVTDPRKASAQFYFAAGNAFEDVVSRAFKKSGLMVDRETRVELDLMEDTPISGRIDFIIKDPDDPEQLVLVELKTCGKLPSKPKPPHLAQLMTYLVLTGMPKGVVWYISRNVADYTGTLKQVAFVVEPTPEERKETALRLAIGSVYGDAGLLPDIPPHMKRYKCGFCPLIPFCWDNKEMSGLDASKIPDNKTKRELLLKAGKLADKLIADQPDMRRLLEEAVALA